MKNLEIATTPIGWEVKTISEVTEVNPRLNKANISDNLSVSFVPMPSVGAGDGSIDVSMEKKFCEVKKGLTPFQAGDVLFAKITPCMENGKMAVVPQVINGYGFGSTEFHVLRPINVISKYLYYYVSSKNFRGEASRHMTGAVGQKRVPTTYIKDCRIPVAPKALQEKIVAEIEKQFSRLDQTVENFKRVKANLKRYKAAVLKAAVEGKLTERWRKAHPEVEPADQFLAQILSIKSNPSIAPHNEIDMVPNGWCVATLDQLTEHITSGSRGWAKYYSSSGDIFIRAQNLKNDKLELEDVAYVQLPDNAEGKRTLIQKNDILITITGANVTKTGIVDRDLDQKSYVNQHIALTRPLTPEISQYLYLWIICPAHGRRNLEKAAYGAGKPGLNLTNIRELTVALPPIEEQKEIIAEVDRQVSQINDLRGMIEKSIARADRLRQSILKKAFSGQLIESHLDKVSIDTLSYEPSIT